MSLKKKTMIFEVKQIGDPGDRVLRFIGSSEVIDRDNDIIEVAGWQLENYLKNPVFLFCHDYRQPPIGKALSVIKDVNNKILSFDIQFATAEEYPFADTIYRLYLGGYMRATSVGFKPMKYKRRDDDAVLDKPEWQRGTRFVEQELLELSAVPVPSNPEALQIARSKGIDTGEVEKFISPVEVDLEQKRISIGLEDGISCRSFSFELLRSLDEQSLEEFTQWKAGSTLNAKNKQNLNTMMDCTRDMMGSAGMTPKGCPCDACDTTDCPCNQPMDEGDGAGKGIDLKNPPSGGSDVTPPPVVDVKSLAQAVAELLKPLLPQKEAPPVVINLDAIEVPKAAAGDNELNIEPETLKQLISDVVKEQLDKARGKIS